MKGEPTKEMEAEVKIANFEEINEEKVLYEWLAPQRPFQKREKDFWITVVTILILLGLILFLIKELYLILAILSAVFLYYVLSSTPPEIVGNKISNKGVYFGEKRYNWNMLERFWMGKEMGKNMVYFETIFKFPAQIGLVMNPGDIEPINKIAVKRIPKLEASPTFQDKITRWVAERLPLENREEDKSEGHKPLSRS